MSRAAAQRANCERQPPSPKTGSFSSAAGSPARDCVRGDVDVAPSWSTVRGLYADSPGVPDMMATGCFMGAEFAQAVRRFRLRCLAFSRED
jgi:hypothetical protein